MSSSFWGDSGGFLDDFDADDGDGADGQAQACSSSSNCNTFPMAIGQVNFVISQN